MFDSPDQDGEVRTATESLQIPALLGFAALILPDVGSSGAAGTIDTSVAATPTPYYGDGSETLINGTPVGGRADVAAQPRTRAKDLIAELKMINGQIHRIMFQVERAMTRLGTSG